MKQLMKKLDKLESDREKLIDKLANALDKLDKKEVAKKSVAKKVTTKKTPSKKVVAKKPPAKKAPRKKVAAKKVSKAPAPATGVAP